MLTVCCYQPLPTPIYLRAQPSLEFPLARRTNTTLVRWRNISKISPPVPWELVHVPQPMATNGNSEQELHQQRVSRALGICSVSEARRGIAEGRRAEEGCRTVVASGLRQHEKPSQTEETFRSFLEHQESEGIIFFLH